MRTSPPALRSVFPVSNFVKFRSSKYPLRLVRSRRGLGALGVGLLSGVLLISLSSSDAFAAATAVNLGNATSDAVVAGSTITNTGPTVVNGDVGLSPGTSITGFPPGLVNGTTDAADATSLAAQTSSTAAYGVAAGETPFATVAGGTLGGTTLVPGIYNSGSALALTGTLTLNAGGDADAVFIFQAGSTLTTASSSSVVLEGGAQACNVFWTVGSSATLGTTTDFVGTILAVTSITLDTGASVSGRLLAQTGAVTLDDNTISVPTCSATPTTTTTTTTTPTTTTTHPTPVKKPVTSKPGTSTGAAKSKGSGTTIIPVGAPATGEGGTAGSSFSPLGLIGLGAIAFSATAASIAWRARRRRS
jgi:hypothetical protein